jgi:hypothetical protein
MYTGHLVLGHIDEQKRRSGVVKQYPCKLPENTPPAFEKQSHMCRPELQK